MTLPARHPPFPATCNQEPKANIMQPFIDEVEAYVDLHMLEIAADLCLRKASSQPDDSELLVYCAGKVSLGTSGQIQTMIDLMASLLRRHPSDFQVLQVRAVLLSLDKRHEEALVEFAKVPDDQLRHDVRWMWLNTLVDAGKEEEMNDWIENQWPRYSARVAEEESSAYLKFVWNVAAHHKNKDRLDLAEEGYRLLLKRDPGGNRWYLALGQILIKRGKLKAAAKILTRGLKLKSKEIDEQNLSPNVIGWAAEENQKIWEQTKTALQSIHGTIE